MKKVIILFLLCILSAFISISVHAAGVAVGCGFTSNIGSPIEMGFDNSGDGLKYKAFKHKDGICMDLGDTKPNLCDLKLKLASNTTQTVVIHVTFFSDIDVSTRRGKTGTEILTLRQRPGTNKVPTDYSTWDNACASTSVETAQAYTKAIKNVRCIEIVHQYDSLGDYVNIYKVTPYRRYTGNESSGRYVVSFGAASANSPLPTVDGNTITFRYRDVNEFLCYVAGGKPLGTSSGLATYYTLSGNSISVEFLTKNNADYMKLRAINTGTSTLTLHRKEAWHFEATSTTYTIVVERRPISYDGIEATYTKTLTYGGNY